MYLKPKTFEKTQIRVVLRALVAKTFKFAIFCDPPTWNVANFVPESALGPSKRPKIEKTKSASFFELDLEKLSFWGFTAILSL